MPLVNAYVSLDALKKRIGIPNGASSDDATLESVITAASRWIDNWTARRFYAASETRYYTASSSGRILVPDDLLAVTTLKTDDDGDRTYETTWSASRDYYLSPFNAVADGRPFTSIERDTRNGLYTFPSTGRGIQVVGSFGYCVAGSVPAPVEEACILRAAWLYERRNAPLGVTGSPDLGTVRLGSDRDIIDLLWPYSRRVPFA